jgi:hypothetical protein
MAEDYLTEVLEYWQHTSPVPSTAFASGIKGISRCVAATKADLGMCSKVAGQSKSSNHAEVGIR